MNLHSVHIISPSLHSLGFNAMKKKNVNKYIFVIRCGMMMSLNELSVNQLKWPKTFDFQTPWENFPAHRKEVEALPDQPHKGDKPDKS